MFNSGTMMKSYRRRYRNRCNKHLDETPQAIDFYEVLFGSWLTNFSHVAFSPGFFFSKGKSTSNPSSKGIFGPFGTKNHNGNTRSNSKSFQLLSHECVLLDDCRLHRGGWRRCRRGEGQKKKRSRKAVDLWDLELCIQAPKSVFLGGFN